MSGHRFWMNFYGNKPSRFIRSTTKLCGWTVALLLQTPFWRKYREWLVCTSPSFVSFKVAMFAHSEVYLFSSPGFPPKRSDQIRFQKPNGISFLQLDDDTEAELLKSLFIITWKSENMKCIFNFKCRVQPSVSLLKYWWKVDFFFQAKNVLFCPPNSNFDWSEDFSFSF